MDMDDKTLAETISDHAAAVRDDADATRELASAARELTAAIEKHGRDGAATETISPSSTAARAGATRGSEPIGSAVGTRVALNVNVNERQLKEEDNRSFVRNVNENERTNGRTAFSWTKVTEDDSEIDSEPIRFLCSRIEKIVVCKPGKWWRNDRRLVVVAAVLASRIDALLADGETGARWLDAALTSVAEFQPRNSAAYFQRCLKLGLGDIDPVMQDRPTVDMLWIQLTKRIEVPEKWLAERPGRQLRQASEG